MIIRDLGGKFGDKLWVKGRGGVALSRLYLLRMRNFFLQLGCAIQSAASGGPSAPLGDNDKPERIKIYCSNFCSQILPTRIYNTQHQHKHTMSSVKRRKIQTDAPPRVSKRKNHALELKEKAPPAVSPEASPEPAAQDAPIPEAEEAEVTKTFKDLVGFSHSDFL